MKPVRAVAAAAVVVVAAVLGGYTAMHVNHSGPAGADPGWITPTAADRPGHSAGDRLSTDYELVDLTDPARTEVRRRSDQTVMATLTVGARTVVFTGRQRRFSEPSTTTAVVESTSWVRIAPRPWQPPPQFDNDVVRWLLGELDTGETPADVLAAAMQYLPGAPERRDNRGIRYAGDAGFGYVHTADERDGADFYDYLEIPWNFPDGGRHKPSKRWDRDLDCSGYLRLIYGYRFGIPLLNQSATSTVDGLPRTAASMAAHARSVTIAAGRNPSRPPADLAAVQPGDLAFFALHDDPALITHSGIVIGTDGSGGMRFVSSRGTVDGPSFGDVRGDGVLNSGYFGDRLRRVIRL